MFEKAKPAQDAFTFSLGGMTAISSFFAMPVIADDRLRLLPRKQNPKSGNWLSRWVPGSQRDMAQENCA